MQFHKKENKWARKEKVDSKFSSAAGKWENTGDLNKYHRWAIAQLSPNTRKIASRIKTKWNDSNKKPKQPINQQQKKPTTPWPKK